MAITGRLEGKVCMVTGAARGIGQAYVRRFVEEGAMVVAVDRLDLTETAALSEAHVRTVEADLTASDGAASAIDTALRWKSRVDVLLNNAAYYGGITLGAFDAIDDREWDHAMDVNVKSLWRMCALAASPMRRQRSGSIINVCSNVVFMGKPHFLHYVASKGAVWALTNAISREFGPDGIRVNAIAPGYTITPATRGLADEATVARLEGEILAAQSIKRLMDAEDLTGAAVFLACEDSAFMTGQTLVVDGGVIVR